jgi:hypothetical protein
MAEVKCHFYNSVSRVQSANAVYHDCSVCQVFPLLSSLFLPPFLSCSLGRRSPCAAHTYITSGFMNIYFILWFIIQTYFILMFKFL